MEEEVEQAKPSSLLQGIVPSTRTSWFSSALSPPPPHAYPHLSTAWVPYPKAGAVRVGANEAETIARNILASHSKSDDGGGIPGQEVLGGRRGDVVELH